MTVTTGWMGVLMPQSFFFFFYELLHPQNVMSLPRREQLFSNHPQGLPYAHPKPVRSFWLRLDLLC